MSSAEELQALSLDGEDAPSRLESLERKMAADREAGFKPPKTGEVNNHIHTMYSFSPYSPAEAAYGAWRSGLEAAGIVDHESLSGAQEMLDAGKKIGIAVTSGCELRVDAAGTALEGRRINNPDSVGLFYMVVHGLPSWGRPGMEACLKGIRKSRNRRMQKQTENLNTILIRSNLPAVDFENDVVPLSRSSEGGSITERHILYALAKKMEESFGRGKTLIKGIENSFGIHVSDSLVDKLSNQDNPHFLYDLLGIFKGTLVPQFFIQPDNDECLPVKEVTSLCSKLGAIPCYPYLGDVGESPTGDKKAEKYEDDWLDDLFDTLPELGFKALTYMPPRNTRKQLARVKSKCAEKNLMEISGVDINSSRQDFRCPEVTLPEFAHLNDRTWALIAHEQLSSRRLPGLFDSASSLANKSLEKRLEVYAAIGRQMDPKNPDSILDMAQKEGLWTV